MPDLPSSRVNPSDPFKHIGLDYAGPFYIFEGPKRAPTKNFKVWVLIVTCLAVRAVHLETALDCTAVAFLNAFRKFVARRGMPRTIVSDNGTNFVAAEKATRIAWAPKPEKEISNYMVEHKIDWKFNTPRAPWRGGVFESNSNSQKMPQTHTWNSKNWSR
uniref:Integrase catalytic domain-containing protein n=1 Tax=Ditylenchus dipsaci TaxID=166011 RepID=A0A915DUQ0_9BILA